MLGDYKGHEDYKINPSYECKKDKSVEMMVNPLNYNSVEAENKEKATLSDKKGARPFRLVGFPAQRPRAWPHSAPAKCQPSLAGPCIFSKVYSWCIDCSERLGGSSPAAAAAAPLERRRRSS